VGTTTAGYANTDETIAVSVNGARGNEVNYKLDGASHMDNVTNLNAAYPNPDAIAEFSVQTSNFSAQYGSASGAVVSMVTRSGTNTLHGTLFEFLRNDTLNARNFFATQRGNLKRNQFGGTLGGPVVKNRLFFFGTYQGTPSRSTTYSNVAFVSRRSAAGISAGNPKPSRTRSPASRSRTKLSRIHAFFPSPRLFSRRCPAMIPAGSCSMAGHSPPIVIN
jgi:TonB-dependent Receptor Plug Domain.